MLVHQRPQSDPVREQLPSQRSVPLTHDQLVARLVKWLQQPDPGPNRLVWTNLSFDAGCNDRGYKTRRRPDEELDALNNLQSYAAKMFKSKPTLRLMSRLLDKGMIEWESLGATPKLTAAGEARLAEPKP